MATLLYPYLRCLEKEDPPVSRLQLEHIGLLTVVRSPGGQSMVHTDGILQVTLRQSLVGPVFILSEVRCVTPGCGLQPHTSRCCFLSPSPPLHYLYLPRPQHGALCGLSPHIAVCPLGISEFVCQNPQVQVRHLLEEGPSSSPGPSPGQKTLSWVPQAGAGYAEGELSG